MTLLEIIKKLHDNDLHEDAENLEDLQDLYLETLRDAKQSIKTRMKENIDGEDMQAMQANHTLQELFQDINTAIEYYTPAPQQQTKGESGKQTSNRPTCVEIKGTKYDLKENTWKNLVFTTNNILSFNETDKFKLFAEKINQQKRKTLFYTANQHKQTADSYFLEAVQMSLNVNINKNSALSHIDEMARFFNTTIFVTLFDNTVIKLPGCQSQSAQNASVRRQSFSRRVDVIPNGVYQLYVHCSNGNVKAKMRIENGRCVLCQGAVIEPNESSKISSNVRNIRKQLKVDSQWILLEDVQCNSPSAAACVVTGKGQNGWDVWKNAQGQPISIYRANAS